MPQDELPKIKPQNYLTKGQLRALSYLAFILVAFLMIAYAWHEIPDEIKQDAVNWVQAAKKEPPAPKPALAPIVWRLGETGNRPILLRNVTVTIENAGTTNAIMIVDIGQVAPQCSPDGEGGEPRPRLIATVHYSNGPDTTVTVREFAQGKKENYAGDVSKVAIGSGTPVNVSFHVRGGCGG
jgi:hypothetical protein